MFADHEAIADLLLQPLLPPSRISVSELARKAMRIETTGGHAAIWSPLPYIVEPMDMLKSRQHRAVVFVGPSRSGKTQALVDGWLLHTILVDPGDFGIYLPSRDLMRDYSRRRIERIHRHCPGVAEMVGQSRFDATLDMVNYRHGMILTLGWPSTGQLAQRDMRGVALSDYDSFPPEIGHEGLPFEMAAKRVGAAGSKGMAMAETSPKRMRIKSDWKMSETHRAPEVDGGLMPIYNDGTRAFWYWRCLDGCGKRFPVPFKPLYRSKADRAIDVHVACPHCSARYENADKMRLNAQGEWRHGGDSDIASYWLAGCAAAFQDWEEIADKHFKAQRRFDATSDESRLISVHNMDMALPYRPAHLGSSLPHAYLATRRERSLQRYRVPDDTLAMFTVVDVQGDRFELAAIGHGLRNERWLIDRTSVRRLPNNDAVAPGEYLEHWRLLIDRAINVTYERSDGTRLGVHATAIDSGGSPGVTERAYEFWRSLRRMNLGHRVFLIKGTGYRNAAKTKRIFPDSPIKSRPGGASGDVPVLLTNVNSMKDLIFADLQRTDVGPGYIHLPSWLPEKAIKELTAERRTSAGWVNELGARNELWDILTYDRALWHYLGGDAVDWDRPPPWLQAPQVRQAESEKRAKRKAKRPSKSFVRDWK